MSPVAWINKLLMGLACLGPLGALAAPPLADVHTHYKWSQADVTTPQQVAQTLRDNHVTLAVVIGTPAEYALRLMAQAPEIVVPVWSPYEKPGDWSTWPHDVEVLSRARAALSTGRYQGIGELHLIGGFTPPRETPVISGLFRLAEEFAVPILLHTEFSRTHYLTGLCAAFPEVEILWAHAGGILPAASVDEVIKACPNVWVELSARDPWRFVDHPITGSDGQLLPQWKALIEAWPERFMIGSDTVWPVERLDSWDEPDTGWQQYPRFVEFHRVWLDGLPPEVARRVRAGNAAAFFRGDATSRDTP